MTLRLQCDTEMPVSPLITRSQLLPRPMLKGVPIAVPHSESSD